MCRLFGFRSVIQSQVHRSLVSADNALAVQSERHPDGWGVAYYVAQYPHLIKSASTALDDALFQRVSGIVSSETVVAHVRKATQGELTPLNSHPFQFGRWVMAHNGDIPTFPRVANKLREEIPPVFRRFILGDTDSEVFFYLFLKHLASEVDIHRPGTPLDTARKALARAVALVREIADDSDHRSLLTFIVTNGDIMLAHHGGKDLFFSTYKRRCPDRDVCASLAPACEAETTTGYVNHFLVSSEPLLGENVWIPLQPNETVAVDNQMRFFRYTDYERHSANAIG
ncbi:MAG: class II glutamine amidotransferase [Myxococcales bacterium]|nr:class II glutamine amidotransferase [Myxococcales bacterium]